MLHDYVLRLHGVTEGYIEPIVVMFIEIKHIDFYDVYSLVMQGKNVRIKDCALCRLFTSIRHKHRVFVSPA